VFFFSSRRRHTRSLRDWSSDVCSSDLWPASSPAPTSSSTAAGPPPNFRRAAMTTRRDVMMGGAALAAASAVPAFGQERPKSPLRSEERRVGEEGRYQGVGCDDEKTGRG